MDLVRPAPDPDRQDHVPEEAAAPPVLLDLEVVELPVYSSDEDDQGEYGVGRPIPQVGPPDEESDNSEFGSSDEESGESSDSGYGTLSEEEEDEERVEETEDEEEEEEEEERVEETEDEEEEEEEEERVEEMAPQQQEQRLPLAIRPRLPAARSSAPRPLPVGPAPYLIQLDGCQHNRVEVQVLHDGRWVGSTVQAAEPGGRAPTPSPQQRAVRPSLAIRELLSAARSSAPRPLPMDPALDFIPLSGGKRVRDEDEDMGDPSSKRPCLSSSNPHPSTSDPAPSTSSGTSGGFRRHFHQQLHLHQDSDSDSD